MSTPLVWHYTVGTHLPAITQTRKLLPTSAPYANTGCPILWFSKAQTWEPAAATLSWKRSAGKVFPPTQRESRQQGLYRFGLPAGDQRLAPWPTITSLARMAIPESIALVSRALQVGASPTDWMGTLEMIPVSELTFQQWDGEEWQEAELLTCAEQEASRVPAPATQASESSRRFYIHNYGASHDLH